MRSEKESPGGNDKSQDEKGSGGGNQTSKGRRNGSKKAMCPKSSSPAREGKEDKSNNETKEAQESPSPSSYAKVDISPSPSSKSNNNQAQMVRRRIAVVPLPQVKRTPTMQPFHLNSST